MQGNSFQKGCDCLEGQALASALELPRPVRVKKSLELRRQHNLGRSTRFVTRDAVVDQDSVRSYIRSLGSSTHVRSVEDLVGERQAVR